MFWIFRFAALPLVLLLLQAPVAYSQGAIDRLSEANEARNEGIVEDAGGAPAEGGDAEPASDGDAAADAADGGAEDAAAAEASAPPTKLDKWNDNHSIPRNRTPSLSWLKGAALVLLLLFWIRTGDWINRDVNEYELGYELWNPIAVLPAVVASGLVFVLPFAASLPLLIVACVGPLVAYALHHNKSVEPHQKVFTPEWFRFVFANFMASFGVKVQTEKKAGYLAGPPVELIALGGDERANQANLITARQSPGFVSVKELLADMATRGSSRVLLNYTAETVQVRHHIDGVWHNGESFERDTGDVMLAVMKQLANLQAKERRKKQKGAFAAEYQGVKYQCPINSQGVKTGEQAVVALTTGTAKKFKTIGDLGMRPKVAEELGELMTETQGLVVFSSLPEGGLTALIDVALQETDRLMRDFVAIEDQARPEVEIENVEQVFFDASAGESPATLMPKLIRKYPDVYVVRDFVDAESGRLLLEQAAEGKLVLTGVNARDAAESLVRLTMDKAPRKLVGQAAIGAVCVKLIRLLCHDCRVGFEPSPDLLKKLGIPVGKVTELFREPKADEIDKPCKACGGIGYRGRTALFELMSVDDAVREAILAKAKPDAVRKAARAAGMRTFQEEGILLIAKGATSLSELQRVLKT